MKPYLIKRLLLTNSRGAALVFIAILMALLIGVGSLVIDIGYQATTRNELQNIADAAALAAAGQLGDDYIKDQEGNGTGYGPSWDSEIKVAATAVGTASSAGDLSSITILDDEIKIGQWLGADATPPFIEYTSSSDPTPNAVQVMVRRDSTSNGPISTFFAKIFNVDTVDVMANATAALTSPLNFEPGTVKLPVGLSVLNFNDCCTTPIFFGDTMDSCAGWHAFDLDANANDLEEMLARIIIKGGGEDWLNTYDGDGDGTADYEKLYSKVKDTSGYMTPGVPYDSEDPDHTADEFNFTGGTDASLFTGGAMFALFDYFKEQDEDVTGDDIVTLLQEQLGSFNKDSDEDQDKVWLTTVPIYDENGTPCSKDEGTGDCDCSCSNPTGEIKIIGQADIVVTAINGPPDNTISGLIDCEFNSIRGGGGAGGNVGTIPNLVE
ncbi:MAG: hypothetical protein J7K75_03420 [Desulfuromonas sp.]|nr:hypothetical protein [Desulfuromonas sp.]